MAAFDLDIIHKYSTDGNLLSATFVQCERLHWELEYLAKEHQQKGNSEITNKLNLVKAQKLLCERLMIGQKIDSLVILVNYYAEILSQPGAEIRKANPQ